MAKRSASKSSGRAGKKPAAGPLYLIDASVYVFRAWFALPDRFHAPDGRPVNAVYGYARFLLGFLARERPGHVVAAFDESLAGSFRNRIYAEYKANRDPAPPELKEQFRLCKRLTESLGVGVVRSARYEADDLIGTLAALHPGPKVILTRDKDLAQLLEEGDHWWDYAADLRYGVSQVRDRFGVAPAQLADYLGLVGDPVDNIPGVPGVGPKAAAALLAAWSDLDAVYANLHRIPELPVRGAAALAARLAAHRGQALLSRELATIKRDVPFRRAPEIRRRPVRVRAFRRLCNELGFGPGLGRLLEGVDAAS